MGSVFKNLDSSDKVLPSICKVNFQKYEIYVSSFQVYTSESSYAIESNLTYPIRILENILFTTWTANSVTITLQQYSMEAEPAIAYMKVLTYGFTVNMCDDSLEGLNI